MKTKGKVTGIISNIVIVKTEGPVAQNEIATVKLGEVRMMAEVIKVVGDDAYIQVFDSTRGLRMGAEVEFEGHMLEATLGPGILSKNYDGLQNDLADMDGLFIRQRAAYLAAERGDTLGVPSAGQTGRPGRGRRLARRGEGAVDNAQDNGAFRVRG